MRLRPVAVLLAAASVALAACGPVEVQVTSERSRQAATDAQTGAALDPEKPPQDYDAYVLVALDDIQSWWASTYPGLYGEPYQPLQGEVYPVYPGKRGVPGCGGDDETRYQDVEGNAFYCENGDFLAYDDHDLFPMLDREVGRAVLALVLAHEWAHAIQGEVRQAVLERMATVDAELQADCFAGAWAAHAGEGDGQVSFDDADVRTGLVGLIQVADPAGVTAQDAGAHGSAFDRVGAFQDGYVGGAEQCATYPDEPPQVIELPLLVDETGARVALDAPFDELAGFIPEDLDQFWSAALDGADTVRDYDTPTLVSFPSNGPYPACDGLDGTDLQGRVVYCADTNEILWDEDRVRDLYRTIGDFSFGYLVGAAWSDLVQGALGSELDGEDRALRGDCLTGAWTGDLIPDDQGRAVGGRGVVITAGDLDEAVVTAIELGDDSAQDDVVGSAFEKIAAFRAGVLGGLDACLER